MLNKTSRALARDCANVSFLIQVYNAVDLSRSLPSPVLFSKGVNGDSRRYAAGVKKLSRTRKGITSRGSIDVFHVFPICT